MNIFANIWQHPKTSVAGLLIAVVTIAGVLGQQGITLGKAGSGTVVSLIGALAAALLGLLAKDPESSSSGASMSTKLGALLLAAALIPASVLGLAGCTPTSSQLQTEASVLATALTGLSAAMSTTEPATAAKIELAAESLTAVVKNWDTSSSAGKLNTVAAGVETVLAGIPATSKYTVLAAVAVAAVDVILQLTGASKAESVKLNATQNEALTQLRKKASGAVQHQMGRSPADDFKAAWNLAISQSDLPMQPLR